MDLGAGIMKANPYPVNGMPHVRQFNVKGETFCILMIGVMDLMLWYGMLFWICLLGSGFTWMEYPFGIKFCTGRETVNSCNDTGAEGLLVS